MKCSGPDVVRYEGSVEPPGKKAEPKCIIAFDGRIKPDVPVGTVITNVAYIEDPSVRSSGFRVAKIIVLMGIKMKPSPNPWMTPVRTTSQGPILRLKSDISHSEMAVSESPNSMR